MASTTYLSAFFFSFLVSYIFLGVKADNCARDWLEYQGNCYGYFETKVSWEKAEIDCQSYARGAHLASILTTAESLVVANHIAAFQNEASDVWIGLRDITHKGRWRWADGSVFNYKSWLVVPPKIQKNPKYCVELLRSGSGSSVVQDQNGVVQQTEERGLSERADFTKWRNTKCQKLNAYICKHEL
ncbi:regenerating islet-derived protein 4-like [Eublepharis macularius]|uniref:Regenerating islet-derived protein 4-like n=1 Tax=Eublepharis macularius TaxID=481883 RepID=A0AA97LDI9_EUBMA|nr:regenerating islet-derived protein 4-like [Eublepharis macularius]